MQPPSFIAFTGVDRLELLPGLKALSARYPIEWGVLVDPAQEGDSALFPPAEVRDALLAVGGITALVGSRIRPLVAGQADDLPFLVYQVTDRETIDFLDGTLADYRHADFEVGIYAATFADIMDLGQLVRNKLDQYGGTISNVEFAPCRYAGETDIEQTAFDGEENPGYCRVQTYRALYKLTS